MTTTQNSVTAPSPLSTIVPNSTRPNHILQLIPIKLDQNNYVLWRALFSAVLCGYDLMDYVDGTFPKPVVASPTESDADTSPNVTSTA